MSDRPLILLTSSIHPDGEKILAAHAQPLVAPDRRPQTLRTLARDVSGIIVRDRLPDDILDHAPRLRGIVRHGVGLDFIPVEAALEKGIAVANLPGSNSQSVAEYVFAALLSLRRPLLDADRALRNDGWDAARSPAQNHLELSGSVLGILGVGSIGRRIAGIASGFGMSVLGTSRRSGRMPPGVEETGIEDLFSRADAIAVACALTKETHGLVNAGLLARMKPSAVIVNISRGPVIDTNALLDALQRRCIAGACLDVFDIHPLPSGSPLLRCPSLILTPHIASMTASSMRAMGIGAAEEMVRILNGERPHNPVSPE